MFNVIVPSLANNAGHPSATIRHYFECYVLIDFAHRPARTSKGHQTSRSEIEFGLRSGKELLIFRIGGRVATLDVMHTKLIEFARDLELVVGANRNTLELHPIAQRCVEDLNLSRPRCAVFPSRNVVSKISTAAGHDVLYFGDRSTGGASLLVSLISASLASGYQCSNSVANFGSGSSHFYAFGACRTDTVSRIGLTKVIEHQRC